MPQTASSLPLPCPLPFSPLPLPWPSKLLVWVFDVVTVVVVVVGGVMVVGEGRRTPPSLPLLLLPLPSSCVPRPPATSGPLTAPLAVCGDSRAVS